jgi:hypothetical protein
MRERKVSLRGRRWLAIRDRGAGKYSQSDNVAISGLSWEDIRNFLDGL